MIDRREFLAGTSALATVAALAAAGPASAAFEITRTKAEWRAILTPAQFAILRNGSTERPFSNSLKGESSPLLGESRVGRYLCGGCELPVYPSSTKFESGTGWPSFWASLPGAVRTKEDRFLLRVRTEVHCRRCGGHLGHIFDDGPAPTGKRHCLNGLAMTFRAAT